jgi:hypothetical protein
MSRIVETYGNLSCGGTDVVPSKKIKKNIKIKEKRRGGEICIYEYSLLCN